MMWAGVSKSGSPISRWMTCLPLASSARARPRTSKAVSVPSRAIRCDRRISQAYCNPRIPSSPKIVSKGCFTIARNS